MKKVFMNNESYEAPLITLVEVKIEQGFAESVGFDEDGEWDFVTTPDEGEETGY